MECKRSQIPAFGYWDFSDDLPITQYFESAAQAGLIRFNKAAAERDLYGCDIRKPIAAPVSRTKAKGSSKRYHQHVSKEQKKQGRVFDVTEPARQPRAPKAVDEDLYKIPPELLHEKPKKKKMLGFWSSCLAPICVA